MKGNPITADQAVVGPAAGATTMNAVPTTAAPIMLEHDQLNNTRDSSISSFGPTVHGALRRTELGLMFGPIIPALVKLGM